MGVGAMSEAPGYSRSLLVWWSTMTYSRVGERVSLVYIPSHNSPRREAKTRVQSSSQEAGPEAETMKNTGYWLVPCGSLSLLFYTPRVIFSGVALPTVLWALPHQSLRKMPYRFAYRLVCKGVFANYFPLSGWLYLFQIDKKPNQDKGWFSKPLVVLL